MTQKIFISYRREDAQAAAGRIFDRLSAAFSKANVFMDVDAIEPGTDFVSLLDDRMSQCELLIAVIGPDWASITDGNGNPRLNNPNDYVRLEIGSAIDREIRLIPVLVDGAQMPDSESLPDDLKSLARRQAVEISHHRFHDDAERLSEFLSRTLDLQASASHGSGEPAASSSHLVAQSGSSWTDTLISFQGRIARKPFWIWSVVLMIASVALQYVTLALAGEPANELFSDYHAISPKGKVLIQLSVLPIWWMAFALIAKRIHDFGHGWGLMTFVVIVTVTFLFFDLLAGVALKELPDPETNATAMGITMLHFTLAIVFILSFVAIGLMKGQTGSNRYGPDPKQT
ncbi:MAG: TIR domain-containing protein [Hyphomicrobiaceae bacterium]